MVQGLETPPTRIHLLLSHPTHAERDIALTLEQNAAGVYRSEYERWQPGRWYISLEPESREWRLVGQMDPERQELNLRAGR
ncbi:hypothetical protein CAI21_00960 [Alkalilimnicola ehrlichii]|uniref:FixH family protein n=1 Tax=Alkalilimnicola ehrlichii TaxID=351052 RepID=UPI000E2FEB94|nr:hypothetical protein CAI21_00960 [Alkalilimnicola ehrlichii]